MFASLIFACPNAKYTEEAGSNGCCYLKVLDETIPWVKTKVPGISRPRYPSEARDYCKSYGGGWSSTGAFCHADYPWDYCNSIEGWHAQMDYTGLNKRYCCPNKS